MIVVTWSEWSDCRLTLHENRKGRSEETMVGSVVCLPNGRWEYRSKDDKKSGIVETRAEAKRALLDALGAQELGEGMWLS